MKYKATCIECGREEVFDKFHESYFSWVQGRGFVCTKCLETW